jgi:NNP family nitrate/nitrite transporter-like MFS transporter
MNLRDFLKAGHAPTLFAAFLYFDLSFMVWVILGPLGVAIAKDFNLDPAQKGLMVAIPVLAGAVLRLVNGVLVDRIGPKRTGIIGQLIVLTGLALAWAVGIHSYNQVLALGLVLGVAGFVVRRRPAAGLALVSARASGPGLGIAGAGNSGTALAALFAPMLAKTFGWQNVIGLAALPLAVAFVVYLLLAKDAPEQPAPKKLAEYLDVLKVPDAWWLMLLYAVTFGGFVGLASSLTIYFNAEYGLDPVKAGFFTAACVFAGSFIRPVGGALADRHGGVRTLTVVYALAADRYGRRQLPAASAWLALAVADVLDAGAGRGQRRGVPTGAAALPQGDRRDDRPDRHDRRHRRLLPGLDPGHGQEGDRFLPDRLPRLRSPGPVRPDRPAQPEGPLARDLADPARDTAPVRV